MFNRIEIEKLKQYQLRKQIEISGIEVSNTAEQDLTLTVTKIAHTVGMNLESKNVKFASASGLKSKKSGEPNNIVVEFENIEIKNSFMKAIKNKDLTNDIFDKPKSDNCSENNDYHNNEPSNPIFFNERNTAYFGLLFKKARDLKRNKKIAFAWVKDGKLFIRKTTTSKIIRVLQESDLNVQ